jgi:hypothetical protein
VAAVQSSWQLHVSCRLVFCSPLNAPSLNVDALRRRLRQSGPNNEPCPTNIVDHLYFVRPIYLVPHASHVHVDKIAQRNGIVIPDFFE